MKPEKPITRKEMYLDVATGGSTELPSPVTLEEKYLAKIAGESVDIPTPVTRYEMLLAAAAGGSYTPTPVTRLEIYLAKAAGQDVEIPQPVTREEMYWFDYCGGTPTPPEREYTGAVPVTFVADGTPLLDYLISGNTTQSGTPTPDSPIMPEGTGELETNLAIISGDSQTVKDVYYKNVRMSDFLEAGTYTVSYVIDEKTGNASSSTIGLGTPNIYQKDLKTFTVGYTPITITMTITLETEGCLWVRFLRASSPTDFSYSASHVRVEKGSTPYGYKIPILSGGVTTPVYLGEVQSERKIKKLVFDGTESWQKGNYPPTGGYQFFTPKPSDIIATPSTWIITHFVTGNVLNGSAFASYLSLYPEVSILPENATANDFKAWLAAQYAAGAPVCLWYVLAEPTTGIVNEPLMRIGDYADTLSMEQAGTQIPTANGSTTLDVETTVKPSEIYIKYRGEAVATLSMLSAEVSSPEATEEVNPEETEEEENGSEDISLQHEFEAIE